jgi:cytochrome c553
MPDRLRRTLCALAVTGLAGVVASGAGPRHVPGHADHVRAYLDAVVHGDVPAAARAASWLADRSSPDGGPAPAAAAADAFRAAARSAAQSGDAAAAAEAAASVFAACGACHQRAGAEPAPRRPARPAQGSRPGHMRTHQFAAERLFDGVAGPSAEAWAEGARALAIAPLSAGDFPVSQRVGGLMTAVERRVHDLAGVAAAARGAPSRTFAYGQLLATCSQCHSRHGTLWERPPR